MRFRPCGRRALLWAYRHIVGNQGQAVVTALDAVQDEMAPSRRVASTRLPAAERRRQILDVALEAFARSGYHDTSMNLSLIHI